MQLTRNEIHDRVRLVAMILFVVSLPLSKLINNLSIVLLALNFLLESPLDVKWERLKNNRLFFIFGLFYLLCVSGMVYTTNTKAGMGEIEKKLALLVFPIILGASNPVSKNHLRIVFKWFIAACTVGSIICIAYACYRNYQEGHTLSYVYNAVVHDIHLPGRYLYLNYYYFTHYFFVEPIHIHPVYFALYVVFSSVLLVWLWIDKYSWDKPLNFWMVMYLVYFFVIVVLTSSRTQLLLLLIVGTVFIIYYSNRKKILVRGIALLVVIYGLGLTIILLNPIARERFYRAILPSTHYTENEHGAGGLSLRQYNWKYSIEAIGHSPIIGVGIGDAMDELMQTYLEHDFKIGYDAQLNPHNQYLHTTLEIGIIGGLLLLISLLYPAWLAWKENKWIYLVLLGLFSVSCLTESMLELNKGIMFYAFFNSLLAFHFLQTNEKAV